MDEPTTGLHPADIDRLLGIVDRLIAGGNTVVSHTGRYLKDGWPNLPFEPPAAPFVS